MGLDIAVIVSTKNHINNFENFAYTLGIAVEKEGEVALEHVGNWKNGSLDVVFGPQGTIVCAPFRDYNVAAASQASQVALLSMSIQEMLFNLECAENGSMKRMYTVLNGIVRRNVKTPLNWESQEKSYDQLLSDCVKEFTGKNFHDYKDEVAIRYGIIR